MSVENKMQKRLLPQSPISCCHKQPTEKRQDSKQEKGRHSSSSACDSTVPLLHATVHYATPKGGAVGGQQFSQTSKSASPALPFIPEQQLPMSPVWPQSPDTKETGQVAGYPGDLTQWGNALARCCSWRGAPVLSSSTGTKRGSTHGLSRLWGPRVWNSSSQLGYSWRIYNCKANSSEPGLARK